MKIKNPIMFILFILFFIVNLIDWITGFFVLSAESNPIFLFTGSYFFTSIVKWGVVLGVWLIYKRNIYPSRFYYFFMVTMTLLAIPMIGLAAYSNILGMSATPEELAISAAIPAPQKLGIYFMFVGIVFVIPFFINLLAFWLYDKSSKNVIFSKEKVKLKLWNQNKRS